MIPETNGTYAVLTASTVPVVAWNDDGDALIAGSDGSLTMARRERGFKHLDGPVEADTAPSVLIPGGGWMADFGDGQREPVIAWGVGRDGQVRPYVLVDDVAEAAGSITGLDFTVVHPDTTAPSTEEADMT